MYACLEGVTAGVLLLVVVALGWISLAAGLGWTPAAEEVEVILLLGLLTAALLLVSLVALLHTRER